jgi:GDP-4-dehydro-6-deoxy-D-mannose reductase
MKAMITGMQGFVGAHLRMALEDNGIEVIGYDIKSGQDVTNYEQVRNFLDKERPDYIYHLAAQAYVPESRNNPHRTYHVNLFGTLNILEAVRQLGISPKILIAGSSEEYGNTEELYPLSHYALSKIGQDLLGQLYNKVDGLHVVRTRAFNHTGPGRGEMYAESSWAKQIVEIENGKREYLEHGNLQTVRNYNDVRDVVRGYMLAIDSEPGWYNICSDDNPTMQDVLDMLISLSTSKIEVKENRSLFRAGDFSFIPPKCTLPGYGPKYSLLQTMSDLINYWRVK